MTHAQIFSRAMHKAKANGWKSSSLTWGMFGGNIRKLENDLPLYAHGVIFNHDFAKALWPDDGDIYHVDPVLVNPEIGDWYTDFQEQVPTELWQKRLMEMVISDDPITYLGENL